MSAVRFCAALAASCACMASLTVSAHAGETTNSPTKWQAWSELGAYAANREESRRGEATLWAPLLQSSATLFFADIRGKVFEEEQHEGNLALGYRQMLMNGWNLGVWGGVDRRRTETGNLFNQTAFGVEALSADWDLRVNGYVPFKNSELVSSTLAGSGNTTVEIISGGLYLVPGSQTQTDVRELAFWGVDAEAGWRVPLERIFNWESVPASFKDRAISPFRQDLRVFLGGYYFDNPDYSGDIAGPRVRAEWQIKNVVPDLAGSRLTFETAWQHDDVRNHQYEAGVRLRIPFGTVEVMEASLQLTPQEERMMEGLKRDTDIVAQSQTTTTTVAGSSGSSEREAVEDVATGVDLTTVVEVENGSVLQTAITNAGSNALVIAKGGATDFSAVTLLANQTLLGGNGTITVRGLTSGTVATFTAPGTQPTIAGSSGYLVTAADKSHIAGIETDGGNYAVLVSGTNNNVVIDNLSVTNASNGVVVSGTGATVTVSNSSLSGSNYGLYVSGYNTNVTVSTSDFINFNSPVLVYGDDATLNSDGNTFSGTSSYVYYLYPHFSDINVKISNNTFTGTTGYIVLIDDFMGHGSVTMQSGSTGNIDTTTSKTGYCHTYFGGSFTGTLSFSSPSVDITSADCD